MESEFAVEVTRVRRNAHWHRVFCAITKFVSGTLAAEAKSGNYRLWNLGRERKTWSPWEQDKICCVFHGHMVEVHDEVWNSKIGIPDQGREWHFEWWSTLFQA